MEISFLMKIGRIIAIIILACFSCENQDFDTIEHESLIVIEGHIEQGRGAEVLVTWSAPYFTTVDSNNIFDFAETKAKVSIFSDEGDEVLTLRPSEKYFPPYIYYGRDIRGFQGREYKLEVVTSKGTYEANTSIPGLVVPDSIYYQLKPGSDTLARVWIRFSDPANEANFYRVSFKRKGVDKNFIPAFASTYSDELFNGKEVSLPFTPGRQGLLDTKEEGYFNVKDTLIVSFSSIDSASFEFWNTLQSQVVSSSNPFTASNARIKSNIEGGLGVWMGNAVHYDTLRK